MDRIPPNNQPNVNPSKAANESTQRHSIFTHIRDIMTAAGEAMRMMAHDIQPYHPNESPKVLLDRLALSPGFINKLSNENKLEIIESAKKEIFTSKNPDAIIAGCVLLLQLDDPAAEAVLVSLKSINQLHNLIDSEDVPLVIQQEALNKIVEIAKLPHAQLNVIAESFQEMILSEVSRPEIREQALDKLAELTHRENAPVQLIIDQLEVIIEVHKSIPAMYEQGLNKLLEIANGDNVPLTIVIRSLRAVMQTLAQELASNGPSYANAKKLFDHLLSDDHRLASWQEDDLLGVLGRAILDQHPSSRSRAVQKKFLNDIEVFFDKALPLDRSLMGKLIGRLKDRHQNELMCKKCHQMLNRTYNPTNPLQNWLLNGKVNSALRPYLDLTLLGGWIDVRFTQTTPENYSKYVDPATRGAILPAVAGQSLVEKWNSFKAKELKPNTAYAPIANKGFEKIDDFIQAFSKGEAQTPKDILARIQNNKPVSILLSLPTHRMSITIADGLLVMTNLGGSFGLQEGLYKRNNPLLGSIIFQLPTPLPDFITEDWIKDLQNDKRNEVAFQEAVDQFYENLIPLGAVNKRGQIRGNCVLDHHKAIIENFLLIAAYNDQTPDEELPMDEDTHGTTSLERFDKEHDYSIPQDKRFVNIRTHNTPIINYQKRIQSARNIYRDITTDIRIGTLLDVVNQEDLIETVEGTFPEDKKAAARRWLFATAERATENIVRFADQRFVKKSEANKDATLETATFNTLHLEGSDTDSISLLHGLLKNNLSEDSVLAQRVQITLEGCVNRQASVNAMTAQGVLDAALSEADHLYASGIGRQLPKLKQIQILNKIQQLKINLNKIHKSLLKNNVEKRQELIIRGIIKWIIQNEMLPPLDAKIFVLEIFTDGMLSENIQALIQEELLPLINNPTTDDNKFLIEVKTEIVKILQNESILYPNDAVRLFRFINSYFFDKKEDEDWIQCLNQLIQPYQALTTNSIEKMKIFIQKIQKYCIEEAPDHGCSSKEIRKLFEKLFLI